LPFGKPPAPLARPTNRSPFSPRPPRLRDSIPPSKIPTPEAPKHRPPLALGTSKLGTFSQPDTSLERQRRSLPKPGVGRLGDLPRDFRPAMTQPQRGLPRAGPTDHAGLPLSADPRQPASGFDRSGGITPGRPSDVGPTRGFARERPCRSGNPLPPLARPTNRSPFSPRPPRLRDSIPTPEAPKHRSTEAPKHRSTEAPKHRPPLALGTSKLGTSKSALSPFLPARLSTPLRPRWPLNRSMSATLPAWPGLN
jgi:hypothetical protein